MLPRLLALNFLLYFERTMNQSIALHNQLSQITCSLKHKGNLLIKVFLKLIITGDHCGEEHLTGYYLQLRFYLQTNILKKKRNDLVVNSELKFYRTEQHVSGFPSF